MVTLRTGRSTLGCLFTLLILAAVAYFGVNVGEVYLRYYEFRDAMQQTARFGAQLSDQDIRRRLQAKADSLGLPESARSISVRRNGTRISIAADYEEQVELPGYVRDLALSPRAEADL